MLVKTDTAERYRIGPIKLFGNVDDKLLKDSRGEALGIEIDTPEGTLAIVSAYVHSGVDTMKASDRMIVAHLHSEISAWAGERAHAIMTMDSNETEGNHERHHS